MDNETPLNESKLLTQEYVALELTKFIIEKQEKHNVNVNERSRDTANYILSMYCFCLHTVRLERHSPDHFAEHYID